MADHLEIFIAPDMVQDGAFVARPEWGMSAEHIASFDASFEGIRFAPVGCRVSRRHWPEGGYVVVLVDPSPKADPTYVETCLLGAILTALGEDLGGEPIKGNAAARSRIAQIVRDGR